MAKVRLQWKPSKTMQGNLSQADLESIRYKSAFDILKRVVRSEGFAGWYKGMHTQITKAVLCQAILFVSKEQVRMTLNIHSSLISGPVFYFLFQVKLDDFFKTESKIQVFPTFKRYFSLLLFMASK
jgi:hypothetical protein